jgi:hypothetical protein
MLFKGVGGALAYGITHPTFHDLLSEMSAVLALHNS